LTLRKKADPDLQRENEPEFEEASHEGERLNEFETWLC
jgi:hypothetical protein